MTPTAESESLIGFSCSGRCSEPLETAREAREIEFGGLYKTFSVLLEELLRYSLTRFWAKAVMATKFDLLGASD